MTDDDTNPRRHGHRLRRMRDQAHETPDRRAWRDRTSRSRRRRRLLDCGWGRLLFGQTFDDPAELAEALRSEAADRRDIALYIRDPHVLLSMAPQELFLDPSHTYRLDLATYRASRRRPLGFFVRRLGSESDAKGGEPHLRRAPDGAGQAGLLLEQARQPLHQLFRRRGRGDRQRDRHGHRRRPCARLRRSGGGLLALVPGGRSAGDAAGRSARRWCAGWRSISRRAARPTWTSP